ncbi:MAG: hypothetical protein JXB13_14310 [Phycisphaerae bacterium]|nr:hypothetical protein [Phycisphaerae bacterium]
MQTYDARVLAFPLWLVAFVVLASSTTAAEGTWLGFSLDGRSYIRSADGARAPEVVVEWYDDRGFELRVDLADLELAREATAYGDFLRVRCVDTPEAGDVGSAALPVVRRLFGVPKGAAIEWDVREGPSSIIDLRTVGFTEPVLPVQGPLSVDPRLPEVFTEEDKTLQSYLPSTFCYDDSFYASGASVPAARVAVTELGVVRGVRLHLLEVRPVAYRPDVGRLTVWPRVNVRLRFRGGEGVRTDVGPAAGLSQIMLNPPRGADLRNDRSGNYLIITAEAFAGSAPLALFANAKTAQGYTVSTYVAVPGTGKNTIKAYIQSLWGTPDAPDYILIVGDALDTTTTAGSFSIPVQIGGGTKHARSDIPYVCMDGVDDWFPDIAIGRIPVRTVSELQDVVDKILSVESGNSADPSFAGRAGFIAGTDPYADAEALHDQIIDMYMTPSGIESNKLYVLSYGATTQDVTDAFNNGMFLCVYFGHSAGFHAWATPPYVFSDIESLTNEDIYPFLVSFSCSSAAFHYTDETQSPGWLEKWLREPDKGAAGAYGTERNLGAYAFSTWGTLYKNLFQAIYVDGIRELSPAAQAAAGHFIEYYGAEDPVSRDYTELFYVLGDPSMRLPKPPPENYLIITAPEYTASAPLTQFVTHKQAMGFKVAVYEAPVGQSNTAIKSHIASLWNTANQPDYVLLVGDTDGFTSTQYTIPHFEGGGDKQAATDWPYVCLDPGDDWYPEIPVGRFSVRSVDSLKNVVNKSIRVEKGNFPDPDYVRRGAFLANPSTEGQAEPSHDFVIDNYLTPAGYDGIRIYSAQGGDTADVTEAVNNGCLWVVYFGHSSSDGWWDPSFHTADVNGLSNENLYGLACGWSCNTAQYTSSECVGETWLRAPGKGAAAYLSASDYIYWGSVSDWAPSVALERSFFAAFFEDNQWKVGPAWVSGLYRFLADYGDWDGDPTHPPTANADVCRNFFEEFVLLGDPALQLPRPNSFTLKATPDVADVCSPTPAVFTLTLERTGTFSEQVQLSVDNLPSGVTATFSSNNMTPPFTSVLTIDDTDACAPGTYNLVLRATSPSIERTRPVQLRIADEPPGAFGLTSPPSGELNVSRTPTLAWETSTMGTSYTIEISEDPAFGSSNIDYSATVTETTHVVTELLQGDTLYYWRARGDNGCGSADCDAPYHFTTANTMDHYTEEFTDATGEIDLDGYTLELTPSGSASFYDACLRPATALPTDPAGGTSLTLTDDGSRQVAPGRAVWLYNGSYNSFYVNANGNITFQSSDGTWNESLAVHFSQPRVAALFDDMNPEAGGQISWKALADRVVVTWQNVPEWQTSGSNTFQIEFFDDRAIHITWLGISCADGIIGLSPGGGVPVGYLASNLSANPTCGVAAIGACCEGEQCSVLSEAACLAVGGSYLGDGTTCTPNPCLDYDPSCLIISEVVVGAESGECPRWIEITNTGLDDFVFTEGGLIVQMDSSQDVVVDVDLTGVTISAGQSFVINSNQAGACTGAFPIIYTPLEADLDTNVPFGDGDDRYILTDKADGSHLVDIYGEFGVDGTAKSWEYTESFSYRQSDSNAANGRVFSASQWYFGGAGSLSGENPTDLLLANTTPGTHSYDEPCMTEPFGDLDGDGDVDLDDWVQFTACYTGPCPNPPCAPPLYEGQPICAEVDSSEDGDVDLPDFGQFQSAFTGSSP